MSLLGIDLGTSGVRVACFSEQGRELAMAAASTSLRRPAPGYVEVDAESVVRSVESAISRLITSPAVHRDPIRAVSFSTMGETFVPVDSRGRALAGMATSMDRRGVSIASRVAAELGPASVTQITGQPLHPMFSVYKAAAGDLGWVGDDVSAYRTLDTFVAERLGGGPFLDYSAAARTGAFDVQALRWSAIMLESVHVPWLSDDKLAEPVPPGVEVGSISSHAAERTGLARGIPLISGLHDQAASFLGAGGRPGTRSVLSLGSSDCLTVGSQSRPVLPLGSGLASYPVGGTSWLTLAGTATGGWALEWLAALLNEPVDDVLAHPADVPPPLLVLPYLAGSGTLDNDPAARGVIAGLTLETSRDQIVRAFLESTGFEVAKILRGLRSCSLAVGNVVAVGTGASNRPALDIRASAAGVPLTPMVGHASLRGAAMVAGVGVGVFPGLCSLPPPETRAPSLPNSESGTWYGRQRTAFEELYRATAAISHALNQLEENDHDATHTLGDPEPR